jgi:uncharacterized membrane protein
MIKRIKKFFADYFAFPRLYNNVTYDRYHGDYLSGSVDMCDLERRLEKLRHTPHQAW